MKTASALPVRPRRSRARLAGALIAVVVVTGGGAAQASSLGSSAPGSSSGDGREITISFVRHAESFGNVSEVINTSVPGPMLTELGHRQAADVATDLADRDFEAIYASVMPRSQQTAEYLAREEGMKVDVIDGVKEIQFGLDGIPQAEVTDVLAEVLGGWRAGNLNAEFDEPGESGHEFRARFNGALEEIYRSGSNNSVVYAHSASIMLGTLLNDPGHDLDIWGADTLRNAGIVTLEGSPDVGWRIVEWNSEPVDAG